MPIGYEVFDGNTADVTTVEDMVELMEKKYGKAKRIWVMDRGMVSEDNLKFLRQRGASYIVGTPKGQLRKFEQTFLEEKDWTKVQPGVEVKLAPHPDGGSDRGNEGEDDSEGKDQYVIARSKDRREKEAAMLKKAKTRLLNKLCEIDGSLKKRPAKLENAAQRLGRWRGRYTRAERYYHVELLTPGSRSQSRHQNPCSEKRDSRRGPRDHRERGATELGRAKFRSVFAAHQLHRTRSGKTCGAGISN